VPKRFSLASGLLLTLAQLPLAIGGTLVARRYVRAQKTQQTNLTAVKGERFEEERAMSIGSPAPPPIDRPLILAASALIGDEVMNPAGEDLGHIKELMIDLRSGRVAYAVLSFGGILGVGDKLFAVPWSGMRLNHQNKVFILDVSKQRLEQAPGFDKDHWPDMADSSWSDAIDHYYGSSAQRFDG
jgi:hypothetical protein